MILVFLLYALFASVFTVAKEALEYSSPFFLVGSRMLFAGTIMLVYQAIQDPTKLRLTSTGWRKAFLLGFFNIYITNVLELWGLQYLTSFKTCFLYSLSPFLSALFSYFLLNERMTKIKWVGLLIGFGGFLPILITQDGSQEALQSHFWFFSWPEIAVIGAVVSSVWGWILLKQLVHGDGCSPIVANGYSMFLGGAFATLHSYITDGWSPLPVTNWSIFIKCTLFLIVISNIVSYNLYGYLLKRFSATFMSFAGLSTPLFTALFGWLFHGEIVTVDFFVSLAIVSLGLFLFYLEELRENKRLSRNLESLSEGIHDQILP